MLAAFILDQHNFSGMGNYIKNEVMYMGGLNVKIKTNELTLKDIHHLYENIKHVVYSKYAILAKGLLMNKWVQNTSIDLNYTFKVYKQKITSDGQIIHKVKVGGRDSYSTEEYL